MKMTWRATHDIECKLQIALLCLNTNARTLHIQRDLHEHARSGLQEPSMWGQTSISGLRGEGELLHFALYVFCCFRLFNHLTILHYITLDHFPNMLIMGKKVKRIGILISKKK